MNASTTAKQRLGVLFFSLGLLLTVDTGPGLAQSLTTGGVSGNITDATGAAIPNASVTLTDLDNGSAQSVLSNGSGEFRFSLLKPGRYTVSASLAGSPVLFNDEFRDVPEPETILYVPVAHWSDGSAAPLIASH